MTKYGSVAMGEARAARHFGLDRMPRFDCCKLSFTSTGSIRAGGERRMKKVRASKGEVQPPIPNRAVARRKLLPLYNSIGLLARRLEQRLTQRFEVNAGDHKLTRAQFALLVVVALVPDLEQAELAELSGYDPATAGVVIGKLEQLGLVNRTRSNRSRRGWLVSATDAGAILVEKELEVLDELQANILGALDPDEQLQLLRLMSKMLGVANSYYQPEK